MQITKRNKVKTTFHKFGSGHSGIDPVDVYFKEVKKKDVLQWDDAKVKHIDYQNSRDDFNGEFMRSRIVKAVLARAENSSRYFKPPRQNNEQYVFPYSYLAVTDTITTVEPILKNFLHLTARNRISIKERIKGIWNIFESIWKKYRIFPPYFIFKTKKLLDKYNIMIEKRNSIVENDLRLVIHIANNFKHDPSPSMGFGDIIQEGNVGLLKTIESFDVNNNVRFGSYGVIGITNQIKRSLTAKSWTIRLPVKVIKYGLMITKERKKMTRELGRKPTIDEISARTDIPASIVEEVLVVLSRFTLLHSLDQVKQLDEYHEEGMENESSVNPLNAMRREEDVSTTDEDYADTMLVCSKLIDDALAKLNIYGRDTEIVKMKLGLLDGLSYEDDQVCRAINVDDIEYRALCNNIQLKAKEAML